MPQDNPCFTRQAGKARWTLSEAEDTRGAGLWVWGLFKDPLYPFLLLQVNNEEIVSVPAPAAPCPACNLQTCCAVFSGRNQIPIRPQFHYLRLSQRPPAPAFNADAVVNLAHSWLRHLGDSVPPFATPYASCVCKQLSLTMTPGCFWPAAYHQRDCCSSCYAFRLWV